MYMFFIRTQLRIKTNDFSNLKRNCERCEKICIRGQVSCERLAIIFRLRISCKKCSFINKDTITYKNEWFFKFKTQLWTTCEDMYQGSCNFSPMPWERHAGISSSGSELSWFCLFFWVYFGQQDQLSLPDQIREMIIMKQVNILEAKIIFPSLWMMILHFLKNTETDSGSG